MKATYIYINEDIYKDITKKARSKKLSLSTFVNIIVKHYQFRAAAYGNTYKYKGDKKVHLKLKDANAYPTIYADILATNCIYEYTQRPTQEIDYNKIDSQIQSECDKTIDKFYDYNNQVRNQTRAIRENKEYYRKLLK